MLRRETTTRRLATQAVLGHKFVPIFWVLPPWGTNGHITSWGEMLAGAPPVRTGV